MVDVLLANAGEMSDGEILAKLATSTVSELHLRRRELIQRRQHVRLLFGHINSAFLRNGPGKSEYETLVRLTDLATIAISRKPLDAPPSIPSSKAQGRKPGPPRDYATATRVAAIVDRIAPDGHWRVRLGNICDALDEDDVLRPKTWKAKGCATWADCCDRERELVIKAIDHHLRRAKEHKKTFS